MLSRFLLCGVLLMMGLKTFGQGSFRVVFAGGRNYIAEENRFVKLKIGQKVSEEARLELVGNAKVVLMDNAGRLFSLDHSGQYVLSGHKPDSTLATSPFFRSIWENYYRPHDQGTTVEEAINAASANPAFELSIPSSCQFFGSYQIIEWPATQKPDYEVQLLNEFGEVFHQIRQSSNRLELDLLKSELVWKTEVSFQVYDADGKRSPLYTIHKMSPPDYEDMDRLLKKYFAGDQFELLLTKAAFFENQWLFADAQTVLQELRKKHGNLMDDYWANYLYRNGFYAMLRE